MAAHLGELICSLNPAQGIGDFPDAPQGETGLAGGRAGRTDSKDDVTWVSTASAPPPPQVCSLCRVPFASPSGAYTATPQQGSPTPTMPLISGSAVPDPTSQAVAEQDDVSTPDTHTMLSELGARPRWPGGRSGAQSGQQVQCPPVCDVNTAQGGASCAWGRERVPQGFTSPTDVKEDHPLVPQDGVTGSRAEASCSGASARSPSLSRRQPPGS